LADTDPDRAEQIARTITHPYQQAGALVELTRALADTDPDRAEQIARTITHPYQQAEALAELTRALANTDPDRAAGVLALLLVSPGALGHLDTVVAVDVAAAVQVADFLISGWT
jgi:hypothetical protein